MMKGHKVKSNKRRMGHNMEWEIRRTEIILKVINDEWDKIVEWEIKTNGHRVKSSQRRMGNKDERTHCRSKVKIIE